MRGVIATGDGLDPDALVERARAIPQMEGVGPRARTSPARSRSTGRDEDPGRVRRSAGAPSPTRRLKVAAYDFGMKWNILRRLSAHGCDVRVYPAATPAAELLATSPDGVFLSNGPGDPAPCSTYAIDNAQALVESGVPVFGICLGHQILGLAMGGATFKLKFGHRGANHPVKELRTGQDRNHVAEPRLRRRSGRRCPPTSR